MTALVYVAVIGFPLALFLGWRYELTPDGLVRTMPETAANDVDLALKPVDYAAITAVVIVSAAIGWQVIPAMLERVEHGAEQKAEAAVEVSPNSIAVLPFADLSATGDQGYLADGLTDTVTHVLGQAKGLIVTARTSALVFRERVEKVATIAEELRVAHVLEGSVQRAGDRVRIIARLVEADGGTEVWSDSYNQQVEDIFDIQDEIATRVLAALQERLPEADLNLTDQYEPDYAAYEQMVLGRQAEAEKTVAGRERARGHYQRAIEIDPDYALAYVRLASLDLGRRDVSMEERENEVWPLVEQALDIDPTLAEAHLAKGFVLREQGRMDEVEASLLKATDLNPSLVDARVGYASFLMMQQRNDEALEQAGIAADLDPKNVRVRILLAQAYWNVARAEAAVAMARDIVREFPQDPTAYMTLSRWLNQLGRPGEGMQYAQALFEMDPENVRYHENVCTMWMQMWAIDEGLACLQDLVEQQPGPTEARLQIAWNTQDYEAGIAIAEQQVEANPWHAYPKMQLAAILRDGGEFERTVEVVSEAFPQLLADEPVVDGFGVWPATVLADAWLRTGEEDKARVLLDATEDSVMRMRKLQGFGWVSGIEDAQIYALRGEHDRALDALETAIDAGWMFYSWGLAANRSFEELWDDERFQALVEKLSGNAAEQRAWYEAHRDEPLVD